MIIFNKAPTGNQFRESKQKETVRHVVLLAGACSMTATATAAADAGTTKICCHSLESR